MASLKTEPLRNYTSLSFEIFIVVFTVLPFFALAYFYPVLPQQVPLFMKLNGDVATWAEKSVISVFRVPLMAVVMQIACLAMKYGTLKTRITPLELGFDEKELYEQYLSLNAGLWDWFRLTIAFKMIAESLHVIFLERFRFLFRPTFIVSVIATLIGAVGAVFYLYRLLVVWRALKERSFTRPRFKFSKPIALGLIICLIAYLLLVLLPR